MISVSETKVDTSWDVPRDVSTIVAAIGSGRTEKTKLRVFFIGEDHWTLGDQQRRHAVADFLRKMGRTAYPLHTIAERGLAIDDEGLPNFYKEDSGLHCNFAQRNENVVDQMIEVVKESHTPPDFVLFFGENHGTEKKGFNQQQGIQAQLAARLNEEVAAKRVTQGSLTGVNWQTFRSIAACIEEQPDNATCLPKAKVREDHFVGLVEFDSQSQNHNMLLAEKGLVKTKFLVEIRNRDAIAADDYWELYADRTEQGKQLIQAAESAQYGVFAKVTIQSMGPQLRIRAFRSAQSPRKKEWRPLR